MVVDVGLLSTMSGECIQVSPMTRLCASGPSLYPLLSLKRLPSRRHLPPLRTPRPLSTQVCVRCRPMNSKEKNENRGHIIDMDLEKCQVFIKNGSRPDEDPKGFTFDGTDPPRLLLCCSCALPITLLLAPSVATP